MFYHLRPIWVSWKDEKNPLVTSYDQHHRILPVIISTVRPEKKQRVTPRIFLSTKTSLCATPTNKGGQGTPCDLCRLTRTNVCAIDCCCVLGPMMESSVYVMSSCVVDSLRLRVGHAPNSVHTW